MLLKKRGRGRLWFFVSFRNFFSDNTRVRIFFSSSEFNIRLYDKNSESDFFFFPPPKSEYFFQQHWESEYFLENKTHNPPLQVKWSFPKTGLNVDEKNILILVEEKKKNLIQSFCHIT
jgi:hypothetical protein